MSWRLDIPHTKSLTHKILLREAYTYAANSDDTRTHTGVVLFKHPEIITRGVNHFPPGLPEEQKEPPHKYDHIIHAEIDALEKVYMLGLTMYLPWMPCTDCAEAMVKGGVEMLIAHEQLILKTPERWHRSLEEARELLYDNGIAILAYDGKIGGVTHLFNGEYWEP